MVRTIRVWYVPYAYGIKYTYGTEHSYIKIITHYSGIIEDAPRSLTGKLDNNNNYKHPACALI